MEALDKRDIASLPPWARKMYQEAWEEAKKRANLSLLSEYQSDPVRFGNEVLGHHYYPDVERVMNSVVKNPVTVVKSATGVGKSYSAADIALWWFTVYDDAEVYITAAPPIENLKNLLWGKMMYTVRTHRDLFKKYTQRELELIRNDISAIHGVTIPMTGTREERIAKFCMDAEDTFELYDGSIVKFSELINKDIPVSSIDENFRRNWSGATFFDNGVQLVYEIIFEDGDLVRRTGQHPLYAGWDIRQNYNLKQGRSRYRVNQEGWVNVENLHEGYAVLSPDSTNYNFGNEELDDRKLQFLAYMIGDGCFIGKRNVSRLQFTQSRNEQLEDFLYILDELGAKYTLSNRSQYNWVCVSTFDSRLIGFISQCGLLGKGSSEKFIPEIIFKLKKEQVALFLNKLFSTDGWACLTNKAEIGYASKSRQLVFDIQRLLRRFGIRAIVKQKVVSWKHDEQFKSGIYWNLYLNHSVDVIRFVEQIGIFGKEEAVKQCYEYAENVQWIKGNWRFDKPDYRWKKIISIKIIGYKPTVGIHVGGDNTFLTSLVEHNSGKHAPHLLFIVDEGDAVPDEIYEGIDGCMSGGLARLLVMFNPKAQQGPVYQMEQEQRAHIIGLSALNHPNVLSGNDIIPGAVTREVIVRRINQWTRPAVEGENPSETRKFEVPDFLIGTVATSLQGIPYPPLKGGMRVIMESAFSYKVCGKYPEQGENQLISAEAINLARLRWDNYVAEHGEVPPNVRPKLGLDIAEYGQDFNAPILRYGNFVPRVEKIWQGVDPTVSGEKAAEICSKHNVDMLYVDGTGYGSSVAPQVSKIKPKPSPNLRCISVKVAEKPDPSIVSELGEFFQLRDQLWWACREWIRTEEAMLPPEPMMTEELLTPTYRIDDRGKIHMMDKDTMREKLKRSPNYADALVLTFVPASRAKVRMLKGD